MSDNKQLNNEQLEKITGGVGLEKISIIVKYRDTQDGIIQSHYLNDVSFPEEQAKDWCEKNNKIYVDYEIDDKTTNTYDAQVLLNTLSSGK